MFNAVKSTFSTNVKNILGWRTNRKIVVFSVDDYGNVRLASKKARINLDLAGMKAVSKFDLFDALETESDLLALFEVLTSVKDKNGKHAVFSAYAVSANINFEKIIEENYQQYHYELLPETFAKLNGYQNTWNLWNEGIKNRLLIPCAHGREHLNLRIFNELLQSKSADLITVLNNRSYTSINFKKYETISYTAAFDFVDFKENEDFTEIISDGLNCFEKVFGFRAKNFNPPGGRENAILHKTLFENGIQFIDAPFDKQEHQGNGKFKRIINYMGKQNNLGQTFLIRNSVFEPTSHSKNIAISSTLQQIEAAFRWKKPAIISSHRVNYCGHIDENNRKEGLAALKKLLHEILKHWPDVEFMTAAELGELITTEK